MHDEFFISLNFLFNQFNIFVTAARHNGNRHYFITKMIENIALIASIISAITALTTSLRAIGVSKELARQKREDLIQTGCRLGGSPDNRPASQRQCLGMYLLSTVIWYCLSIAAAVPSVNIIRTEHGTAFVLAVLIPFVVLILIISFIWINIMKRKN